MLEFSRPSRSFWMLAATARC